MPARLNLFTARNAVSVFRQPYQPRHTGSSIGRPQVDVCLRPKLSNSYVQRRANSSTSDGKANELLEEPEQPKGPNQDQLPHVNEEAAAIDKILSGKKCDGKAPGSPELEQGTPVDEIFRRDKDALKYAPKVFRDQASKGSRSYSTSARLRQQDLQRAGQDDQSVTVVADMIARVGEQAIERQPGLKFDMPTLPLPRTEMVKRRYDPLVEQFTKLLMRDGKLSLAQKNMAYILDYLRTASPPKIDPRRRLMTSMPSPQLPLNPVVYLSLIVDSVAPLIKIRQQKGIQGGGAAVPVPVPLAMRQRRRAAIQWILDAADRRNDSRLAVRVAQELTAVAEGRSGIWDKREQIHKLGVAGRSNLQTRTRPSRF